MFENAKVTIDLKDFNYLLECEKELKKYKMELEKFKNGYKVSSSEKNDNHLKDAIQGCLESLTKS